MWEVIVTGHLTYQILTTRDLFYAPLVLHKERPCIIFKKVLRIYIFMNVNSDCVLTNGLLASTLKVVRFGSHPVFPLPKRDKLGIKHEFAQFMVCIVLNMDMHFA